MSREIFDNLAEIFVGFAGTIMSVLGKRKTGFMRQHTTGETAASGVSERMQS
jgi:hypothetical protein